MNVKDFHIQYNYIVRVENIKNIIGCRVSYPKNIFNNYDEKVNTYLIADNSLELYDDGLHSIDTPNYASRVLIVADIVMKTLHRQISTDLIILYKDGECIYNASILNLLDVNLTDEELKRERELTSVFQSIVCGIKPKSNPQIKEGLDLVIRCFERGGLL